MSYGEINLSFEELYAIAKEVEENLPEEEKIVESFNSDAQDMQDVLDWGIDDKDLLLQRFNNKFVKTPNLAIAYADKIWKVWEEKNSASNIVISDDIDIDLSGEIISGPGDNLDFRDIPVTVTDEVMREVFNNNRKSVGIFANKSEVLKTTEIEEIKRAFLPMYIPDNNRTPYQIINDIFPEDPNNPELYSKVRKACVDILLKLEERYDKDSSLLINGQIPRISNDAISSYDSVKNQDTFNVDKKIDKNSFGIVNIKNGIADFFYELNNIRPRPINASKEFYSKHKTGVLTTIATGLVSVSGVLVYNNYGDEFSINPNNNYKGLEYLANDIGDAFNETKNSISGIFERLSSESSETKYSVIRDGEEVDIEVGKDVQISKDWALGIDPDSKEVVVKPVESITQIPVESHQKETIEYAPTLEVQETIIEEEIPYEGESYAKYGKYGDSLIKYYDVKEKPLWASFSSHVIVMGDKFKAPIVYGAKEEPKLEVEKIVAKASKPEVVVKVRQKPNTLEKKIVSECDHLRGQMPKSGVEFEHCDQEKKLLVYLECGLSKKNVCTFNFLHEEYEPGKSQNLNTKAEILNFVDVALKDPEFSYMHPAMNEYKFQKN